MRAPDDLARRVESGVEELVLHRELGDLAEPMRYALGGGGKRIRPVLCLATAEAAGGTLEDAAARGRAVELVHSFSLVHDDLPALDDDDERRGRPSAHVAFGEGVALLAGDALLGEASASRSRTTRPSRARELAQAALGMIGGQYLDVTRADVALDDLHGSRRGAVRGGRRAGALGRRRPRGGPGAVARFGEELGVLFQAVDDVIDGDGYAAALGVEGARDVAASAAGRAHTRLEAIDADTSILAEIVDSLAVRTS